MFMLAEKQPAADEPAHRFWIDPDVEVALNAQINEHYRPDLVKLAAGDNAFQAQQALMGCYCRESELANAGLVINIIQEGGTAETERQAV